MMRNRARPENPAEAAMLRMILIYLAVFIYFVPLGLPALLLVWLVGLFAPKVKDRLAYAYGRNIAMSVLFLSGSRVTVLGEENIPTGRPVLFISNHRGIADIFCALKVVKSDCCFISKQEWGKIPLLRDWMKAMHCIFLDRSSARSGLAVYRKACEALAGGSSIWVCPEGTRAHDEQLLHFKEGSFRPAFQTGVPILPVTFVHTDDMYELHKPFFRPAQITVSFGKCVETQDLSRQDHRELAERIREDIQRTYDTLV